MPIYDHQKFEFMHLLDSIPVTSKLLYFDSFCVFIEELETFLCDVFYMIYVALRYQKVFSEYILLRNTKV